MKTKLSLLLFVLGYLHQGVLFAQREWVVVNTKGADTKATYGTLGVPSPDNIPGGRFGASSCTDKDNNLWLFGGSDFGKLYNDLWRFDVTTYQWTWVSGSNEIDQSGVFGQLGVPSLQNMIGCKTGAAMWADDEGNLWVYGGLGKREGLTFVENDLWRYNIKTKIWTWMNGSSDVFFSSKKTIYGTMGVADAKNTPGSRYFMLNFKDKAGNLWLFSGNRGNDLWKYDIKTGYWTWMKGNNAIDTPGQYGQLKVENATNLPDSRMRPTGFLDNDGNFWVFGGEHFNDDDDTFYLNDLWRYNLTTNNWTWMGGTKTFNDAGQYGTKKVASKTNLPMSREEGSAWVDNNNVFWLFGGQTLQGYLNDTWTFNPSTDEWTWVEGSNTINQLGNCHRTPETGNTPGARVSCSTWEDALGTLWLFGGSGKPCSGIADPNPTTTRNLNDMNKIWIPPVDLKLDIKYDEVPTANQKQQLVTITVSEKSKYGATRIKVENKIPKGLVFEKRKTDLYNTGEVIVSKDSIYWNIPFVVPQTSVSLQYYTKIDSLNKPFNDLTNCATITYQYAFESNGQDNSACTTISIITSNENIIEPMLSIFPNPTADYLNIVSNNQTPISWEVVNNSGQVVNFSATKIISSDKINLRQLTVGMYFVRVYYGNKIFNYKIVKE